MEIAITKGNGKAVITIHGKIDEAGAEQLKASFTALLSAKPKEVVVDMKNVAHIGSSGIGKILLFYKNLSIGEGSLQVINLSPILFELFKELKLDSIFTVSKQA